VSDGDDVASESGAGRPERRPARGRAESGPAASPETEALTISLPIELIDQVQQWASHNEIGLDELRPSLMIKSGSSSRLMLTRSTAVRLLSTTDSRTPTFAARRLLRRRKTSPTQSPRLSPSAGATRSRIVEESSRLGFSNAAVEVRDGVRAVNSTTAKTPALTASTTS